MAEDGEEKSDLKITNYRGWGLGEGGKGGARGSEGAVPLKSLKSSNSSILGILRVLFMMVFFLYTSLIHFSLICLLFLDDRNFVWR